ncbi:MAG: hypothetical protein JWN35_3137 [Frankiales bacterium]|jgi:hypothetical protein|nr:hypothetical protein [Frankiales bacterium]
MSMRGSVAKSGVNLRRRTIRRRVIALGVAGVTIAGAQIGVSMLGDTGSVDAAVTTSSATSRHIYASNPLPGGTSGASTWGPTGWAQTVANGTTGSGSPNSGPVRVSWAAAPSTTGSIATAGDVAVIDATTDSLPAGARGVAVTMYISNLAGFMKNYSSFALPVGVYQWTGLTWAQLNTNSDFYSTTTFPGKNSLYISDSDGSVSLNLPALPKGTSQPSTPTGYYEIVIEKTNGFWQSVSSFPTPVADLGPSFYLTSSVY